MTHKELDDLFRANSERGEFAPEPGEWEAMTALLDEDERKDRYAQWVSIAWMSLFVLLISGGVYGLWATQQSDSDQQGISIDSNQPIASLQEVQSSTTLAKQTFESANQELNTSIDLSDNALATSSNNSPSQAVENTSKSVSSSIESASLAASSIAASSAETDRSAVESPLVGTFNGRNTTTALLVSQDKSTSLPVTESQDNLETNTKLGKVNSAALIASNELIEESLTSLERLPLNELNRLSIPLSLQGNQSPKVSLPDATWSRFGLGFFVAQELNSVAMSDKMRLGTRAGVQLRYNPLPKWSIDLGASYARKSYMAPKGEMQNTLGLFFDDVLPAQTDGECDILEIPLTLTYLPNGHGNAGPFISGGLISYRIFREEMVFHYDQPTSQTTKASAPDKGALFGTSQLQVGYQFVPNKGPAWRVGPYLHVPISMVGSGDLPIYSVGLQAGFELF